LVEAACDQILDGRDRVPLVHAGDGERDPGALRGGEQQDPEDALAVDLLAVLADLDLGLEAAGRLDELGGGPGVQAESVADRKLALNHDSSFCPTTTPWLAAECAAGAASSASRSDAT